MNTKTLFLAAAALLATALSPAATPGSAFRFTNETLEYTVHHGLFPWDIATVVLRGEKVRDTYRATATVTTDALWRNIYTLDAYYSSQFQCNDNVTPVRASHTVIEKRYWRSADYTWTSPRNMNFKVMKKDHMAVDATLSELHTVRDILGLVWWIRSRSYENVAPQEQSLVLDHGSLRVYVNRYERKSVRMADGMHDVIEVTVSQDRRHTLTVLLSDDSRRVPLRFSVDLPFGAVEGRLSTAEFVEEEPADPRAYTLHGLPAAPPPALDSTFWKGLEEAIDARGAKGADTPAAPKRQGQSSGTAALDAAATQAELSRAGAAANKSAAALRSAAQLVMQE